MSSNRSSPPTNRTKTTPDSRAPALALEVRHEPPASVMPDGGLVFTFALRGEMPLEWLHSHALAIIDHKTMANGDHEPAPTDKAVLFVRTGMGPERAAAAARWIATLRPHAVVNIGTAGSFVEQAPRGTWITPATVESPDAEPMRVDARLPFAWPAGFDRQIGGRLRTVAAPVLETPERPDHDFVDMEADAQARVFAVHGIAFHVLKLISDRPGPDTREQFLGILERLRRELERILAFVEGPGTPQIAAVVPVHNRAHRIAECVESIIAQTLPATEIVVVDDGSTDAIEAALDPYSERVRVLRCANNQGVSAARNLGVSATRAAWIAFLDSDDRWAPGKLEAQWRHLQRHPYLRILQSEEIWLRDGLRINPCRHHAKPAGWAWERCLERCLVSPSAVLLHRSLFASVGAFDETLPACEDYDLWLRIARNSPLGLTAEPCVIKHGGHADQLSRRYAAMDAFRVRALAKALAGEHEPYYRAKLGEAMRTKLAVLIKGARRRGRDEDLARYHAWLDDAHRALEGRVQ